MKTEQLDSNQRIAFPVCLFAEGNADYSSALDSEIHIVPTGKWVHWSGFEFEITSETVAEMVRNFNAKVRKGVYITAGHDNGMNGGELPAVGWFKELTDHGVNGLYGYVDWNDEGKRLLADKQFKYFSAELKFDYVDIETGEKYDVVLTGGALTNSPFFKQLDMDPADNFSEQEKGVLSFSVPTIVNQFNLNDGMDLKTIIAKNIADLTTEEKAFLNEHKAELSTEELTALASVIEADQETEADRLAREEQEKGDANEAAGLNRDGSTKVDASDKGGKGGRFISASELSALETKANQGVEALTKIRKMELSTKVEGLVLSVSNKTGRILDAEKASVVKFMEGLTTTQVDQFVNILNKLPKTAALFKEHGDSGKEVDASDVDSKAKEIDKLAHEKMAKHFTDTGRTMKYSDATKKVVAEHPELAMETAATAE